MLLGSSPKKCCERAQRLLLFFAIAFYEKINFQQNGSTSGGSMKKALSVLMFRGTTETVRPALDGLSALVDHLIRLFTALGFLTGLINLREIYPDNDLIAALLLLLGSAVFLYTIYIFDYLLAGALSLIPHFKKNDFARSATATALGIGFVFLQASLIVPIGAFLAEIKPFG